MAMLAEPLDKGLAKHIESGLLLRNDFNLTDMLVKEFDWDELTADSIWAFGPNRKGTNMLIDYTIESEINKPHLRSVKDSIVQGF
eukprot:CAMPEP_0116888612 /NCGR_PEP_ID=MMETSP0463-20121206/23723_1 /TAXON_ID=181622 /ORGANISM="Strombidinopsis sp, Strain SopsisLIS2011" /LENGTH=84 /DNA_ID=CAMNT_0004553729 /DNA_START=2177 /DNA_END=2431 /DNA_ORIENTATION=+